MRILQSTLSITLLLSTAGASANNIWVVNLTNKPITSVTFLLFHKSKGEIVGSQQKNGDIEKREFKNIAPWLKSDGQSIDSTLSNLVVGKRGSKLCEIFVTGMKPSDTVFIQGNPYQSKFLFDCDNTPAFVSNLIVWGNATLIIENDPSALEKITKKVSHFKMKIENNSPYESKYLIAKNEDKPIKNWGNKDSKLDRLKKKFDTWNKEKTTNE